MGKQIQSHETRVTFAKPTPLESYAGTDLEMKIQVSCARGCNLVGQKVRVMRDDQTLAKEIELPHSFEGKNEAVVLPLNVPLHPGSYTWSILFPQQVAEGLEHLESSAPFTFTVHPHTPSIAVWDIPSPISFNSRFAIKLGVKCSASCKLAGEVVEIYDQKGEKVSGGMLSDNPWPGSTALYWTEVSLPAPDLEDYFTWRVNFVPRGLAVPHRKASTAFGFHTAPQPDHKVTVQVMDQETQAPVKDAYVMMNIYRTYTDEAGVAILKVPQGAYQLSVYQKGREIYEEVVRVDRSLAVKAELLPAIPTF